MRVCPNKHFTSGAAGELCWPTHPWRAPRTYASLHRVRLAAAAAKEGGNEVSTANIDVETKTPTSDLPREGGEAVNGDVQNNSNPLKNSSGRKRQADSTDWVASQLTRRFGIAGGLAWLGILTIGVVGEQVKTRLEEQVEREGTKEVEGKEVVLPSGLRYEDMKVGGGPPVQQGYLLILDYKGTADGRVYEDTVARGKPIVFLYGSRPFTGGMCPGLEEALATMRAGGVRRVFVPPELGYGERGLVLRPTEHVPEKQGSVPPGASLEVVLEVKRVSIPPS